MMNMMFVTNYNHTGSHWLLSHTYIHTRTHTHTYMHIHTSTASTMICKALSTCSGRVINCPEPHGPQLLEAAGIFQITTGTTITSEQQ